MSDLSSKPLVTAPAATQPNVVPKAPSGSDNETLKVQRRFRLSGNGFASRTLQSAILAFVKQKEN
jgi:hypothetical protein